MNEILNLIPTVQSIQLLGNIKKKKKKLISSATDTIIGTSFIQAEANILKEF